jgi:Raf kinase inhibitor-like YbhB/YbcL family protein
MKQRLFFSVFALMLAALSLVGCGGTSGTSGNAQAPVFRLSSPDIAAGGTINNKYILNGFGCTGQNVSPALVWSNVPPGTKSLTLQMFDQDAPTGSGFWHWAVYNIPPTTTGLAQGAGNNAALLPAGAFGGNTDLYDIGLIGSNGNYGGPCAPQGDRPHHYVFTLYALNADKVETAGGIPKTASPALFSFVINKAVGSGLLGKASFTGTFSR